MQLEKVLVLIMIQRRLCIVSQKCPLKFVHLHQAEVSSIYRTMMTHCRVTIVPCLSHEKKKTQSVHLLTS